MPQICSVTFTYRNSTVLQRIIYSERLFTFLWLYYHPWLILVNNRGVHPPDMSLYSVYLGCISVQVIVIAKIWITFHLNDDKE